ncbi:MAG: 16S rRNA (cytidine(1402)-2'-O)-methyltransferase [Thermodesulfobacteriota bacterium]
MALYVVATPIGNLEDITLRAVKVLGEVSLIAAEDTRRTKKLLTHYGIKTPQVSYHEHNERTRAPMIVERLKRGEDVALVSDAGTPGISDPGYRLVRLASEESVPVVAVPGPSAVAAAMSVAGLPTDEFTFKGFVPQSARARRKFFLTLRGRARTCVMYESPKRLVATLECMLDVLGDVEVAVAREMTKVHEEVVRARVAGALERFRQAAPRGEITLVVRVPEEASAAGDPAEEMERLLGEGLSLKEVAGAVADLFGMSGSDAYREALKVRKRLRDL